MIEMWLYNKLDIALVMRKGHTTGTTCTSTHRTTHNNIKTKKKWHNELTVNNNDVCEYNST